MIFSTRYLPYIRNTKISDLSVALQLVPFPFDLVQRELRRYPNAEFMWAQEEPMNMGGYAHICPRLETCMRNEDREVTHLLSFQSVAVTGCISKQGGSFS